MKLTDILFEEVKDIWEDYLSHPFVKGIGDGSLEVERFSFYMLQDYLYLIDYAKVFALGVVKSRDLEMMQFFSSLVYSTLNEEMTIHRSYMKRLGIDEKSVQDVKQTLDNISYTHYMLEIGHNEGILELLVSILSCSWSYAYIGQALNKIPGASEHEFYGEWIKGYSCAEYIATNQKIIDMIDALGKDCSNAQINRLKEIFVNCSRYEAMFWDMAYNGHSIAAE